MKPKFTLKTNTMFILMPIWGLWGPTTRKIRGGGGGGGLKEQ